MKFKCYLEFKNVREPHKRMRVSFVMRANGFDDIESKLWNSGHAPVFFGWDLIETHATNQFDRDDVLLDSVCTYSKKRGFGGTFKTSPIWESTKGVAA